VFRNQFCGRVQNKIISDTFNLEGCANHSQDIGDALRGFDFGILVWMTYQDRKYVHVILSSTLPPEHENDYDEYEKNPGIFRILVLWLEEQIVLGHTPSETWLPASIPDDIQKTLYLLAWNVDGPIHPQLTQQLQDSDNLDR
jgi:hypothetical protein